MFRRFFSNSTLKANLTFEINKIANYSNYFEIYDIDILFFINKTELESKYNNLLKTLNSNSFKSEIEYNKYKNVLDNSYTTLTNDLERAKYIINLKRIMNTNKSDDILNKEYRKCIINLYSKIEELENKPPKIIYRNKCTDAQVRARRRIRPWL